MRAERESFRDQHDVNSDGFMDQEEVQRWILPDDYDHTQAEAQHLIRESDRDKVVPPHPSILPSHDWAC